MKKIIAVLMTLAMVLSLGAVVASALTTDEIDGVGFTPGGYSVDNAADFSSLGTVKITWDPDASQKLNVTDGDMSDWAAAGYNMVTVDASNMVYWVKDETGVPAGWQIQTYFVADKDNLYIGFYVTDPAFAYGNTGAHYDGDAFQVCIDFGGLMGKTLQEDPDVLSNPKNIFYSFSCTGDGAPLEIMRQEADNNGFIPEEEGAKGSSSATEAGWCAEFALPFQMLYDDYVWKAWADDPKIYVGSDQHLPLNIGCCLYYLDRSETAGTIHWAAGSTNGITDANGTPCVSWSAYDNGINLELDWSEDLEFTCEGIVVVPLTETTPEETTAEETTPEETTEAPTEEATTEEATTEEATTEEATTEETTTEATGGCGSVIGFSAIAVLAAAAAAVALKKD